MEERLHRVNAEAREASSRVSTLQLQVEEAKRKASRAEALRKGSLGAILGKKAGYSPTKIELLSQYGLKEAEAARLSRELGFARTDFQRLQKELEQLERQAGQPEDAHETAAAKAELSNAKKVLHKN